MTDFDDLRPEDMSDLLIDENELVRDGDIPMSQFEPDESEEMTDEGLEEGIGEGTDIDEIGERAGINYDPLSPLGEVGPNDFTEEDEYGIKEE